MKTAACRIVCVALFLSTAAGATQPEPDIGATPPGLRLGDAVRPEDYRIQLRIDPGREAFDGVVDITLQVSQPTDVIWLHARDLDVSQAELTVAGETRNVEIVDGGEDHVGLRPTEPLERGRVALRLSYSGRMRKDEVSGLFRRQVGEDWYVFSQMEPLDARRVFPGFDEPGFKVPFEVSMTVPPGHSAFFNTPRTSSEIGPDGWTTVHFATSKPLPTYLLAFGAGPFDLVDAGTAGRNKTKIRIIVPKGKSSHADWAARATGPILELLEDYFDMPYPYEKLDQIAIPQVGYAMEHPGLVTYGQRTLLSAPEDDTVSRRRRFASVCAHELAHMWFGDLVTMEWWDDLWLNESFATWMAAKIVDRWQPEWEWRVQQAGERQRALRADSLGSARQIRQPITSSDDVLNAFDGITYAKGRAVLWMFESWIGEEALRNGVRSYVRKHVHGNATAVDFLTELGKASNPKVTEAFLTFIEQNGVPRLDVEPTCPEDGPPRLRLTQSRYVPAGAAGGAGGPQTWRIPICVRFGRGDESGRQCMLLTEPDAVMTLETKECPDWVLPNADAAGYYHVAYDSDMLDRLFEGGGRRLTKAEQVGVAQDMRAMVASGDLAEGEALARVPVLMAMDNRHVVASASDVAAAVEEMVPEELTPAYRRFVRETFGPEARRLGWKPEKGEDEETVLLRPGLLGLVAVEGEEPELIAQARALAGRWLEDRSAIDPALVDAVLEVAGRNADEALWNKLLAQVRTRPEEKLRRQLFNAMGAFIDPEIVKKNLAVIGSGEFEVFETVPLFFGALAEPPGREVLFAFIRENYDQLLERVPQAYQAQLIYGAGAFCDEPHIDSVEEFFGPRVGELEGGPRTLAQVLERMRVCVARREAQRASVTAFLAGW